MALNIPHSHFDLLIALLSLSSIPNLEEKMDEMTKKWDAEDNLPKDKVELNRQIAAHNGITVETLINSPNMTTLKDEYVKDMLSLKIEDMKKELGLTDKQAWAIIAKSMGVI